MPSIGYTPNSTTLTDTTAAATGGQRATVSPERVDRDDPDEPACELRRSVPVQRGGGFLDRVRTIAAEARPGGRATSAVPARSLRPQWTIELIEGSTVSVVRVFGTSELIKHRRALAHLVQVMLLERDGSSVGFGW